MLGSPRKTQLTQALDGTMLTHTEKRQSRTEAQWCQSPMASVSQPAADIGRVAYAAAKGPCSFLQETETAGG